MEVFDPRNQENLCVARITKTLPSRIGLRLLGEISNEHDFWHMVDSADIHPIGYRKEQDLHLKPPTGEASNGFIVFRTRFKIFHVTFFLSLSSEN